MTDGHYKRVQERVRREIEGTHESSIWVALALATFSVAATVWLTVLGTDLKNAAQRGKLEVVGWAAVAVTLLLIAVHFITRQTGSSRADDVIKEMDTYCYHTVAPPEAKLD